MLPFLLPSTLLCLLLLSRRLSFAEFRRFFMLLPQQGQLVEYWLSGPAALQCADMGGHFSILERNRHSGAPWGECSGSSSSSSSSSGGSQWYGEALQVM
jgi:hypothetical protein